MIPDILAIAVFLLMVISYFTGRRYGKKAGYTSGYKDGHKSGYETGYNTGKAEIIKNLIIQRLHDTINGKTRPTRTEQQPG